MYIGKHEAGEVKLRKIVSIAEDDYKINALVKLAEFYFQNNKLDDAAKCLKEAEGIDPSNPDVYYIRSQVSSALDRVLICTPDRAFLIISCTLSTNTMKMLSPI